MGASQAAVDHGPIDPCHRRDRARRTNLRRALAALLFAGTFAFVVPLSACGGGSTPGADSSGASGEEDQAETESIPDSSSFDLDAAQPCTWLSDASLETVFDASRPTPQPGGLPTTKTCKWEDQVAHRMLQVNVASPQIYDMTAELPTTTEFEGLGRPAILSPSDVNDGIMVVVQADGYSLIIDMTGVASDDPGLLPLVEEVVTGSGL